MAQPTLTPREFAQKWGDNATKEKAASQEHFIDLCRMLGEPTPNEADPTGQTYAFEKAVTKAAGGDGFAAEYENVANAFGLDIQAMRAFARQGIEPTRLDDSERRARRGVGAAVL